jgi:hypothetical protein
MIKFNVLMLMCEADSKLPYDVEMAYSQFVKDFKKETGKDVKTASLKELKDSRAWKKMRDSLRDPTPIKKSKDEYNYLDHIDDMYARYA